MDHLTSANWYTNCNGLGEFLGGTQQFPSMEQGSVDTQRQFTALEHVQYTTLVPSGGTQYVEEPDVYAPMNIQQSTKESLPLQESRLHHRRPPEGEKILCPECGATFACLANLRNHLRIHTGERPYVCEECGSSFTQRSNLRSHKRVHTGERPYMCGICGQTFARSSHLPGHMRTHTGEKPFTCPHCSRSFATNQIMKNHMRTHTGERPFVCEICEATFAQSSCLATHKKIHTGERKFKCGECGKAFISRSGLQTHERVHTGEKPYKCEKCTKSFKTSSYLSMHKQKYCGNSSFKKRVRKPDDKKLAQRPAGNRKMGKSRKTVKNSGKPPKTNKTKRLRHPKRHCNNESEAEVKAKENIFLKPIPGKPLRDADYSHVKQEESSLNAVDSYRSTEPLSILGLSPTQEYSKLTKEGSFLMSCIKTEYHIFSGTNEVKDLLETHVYGETQCELQEAYPQVIDIQHQVGVDSILKEAHSHSIPESIVCPQHMASRDEFGTHSQAMQALPPVSSISMPTVALQQAYL